MSDKKGETETNRKQIREPKQTSNDSSKLEKQPNQHIMSSQDSNTSEPPDQDIPDMTQGLLGRAVKASEEIRQQWIIEYGEDYPEDSPPSSNSSPNSSQQSVESTQGINKPPTSNPSNSQESTYTHRGSPPPASDPPSNQDKPYRGSPPPKRSELAPAIFHQEPPSSSPLFPLLSPPGSQEEPPSSTQSTDDYDYKPSSQEIREMEDELARVDDGPVDKNDKGATGDVSTDSESEEE